MVNFIKRNLKKFIRVILKIAIRNDSLSKVLTEINNFEIYEKKFFEGKQIYLIKKNYITKFRNDTIFTKEPETVDWLRKMEPSTIFWDIGANIGLYSILSSLSNSRRVVSFEPSFFNLQILSKNIFKNNLSEKITIVPLCLDDISKTEMFKLKSIEEGGALSNFGNSNFKPVFEYKTISTTLNEFFEKYEDYRPDYIKIDVDGIENQIISGGSKVFKKVKSVLIESNSDIDEKNITQQMEDHNFYLKSKDLKNSNLIFFKNKN